MFRKSALYLFIGVLVFSSVVPAIAADNHRDPEARYDPFSNFGQKAEVVGGVYLRIPFTGGLRQQDDWRWDEPRIGFALGAQLPNMPRYSSGMSPYAPRVIDLSMGFSGADSLQLNGINLIDRRIMLAGENGNEEKKSEAGRYVVGFLAVIGAAGLIATFASNL